MELAMRMGVSRAAWRKWCAEKMSLRHIVAICIALDVRADLGMELVRLAGHSFLNNKEHNILLAMMYETKDLTVARANEILRQEKLAPLTEGKDEEINGYKSYFTSHGQVVYDNPSPGNKAGGITTLEEKSLGCTQKSGSSPVMGVLKYGDRIQDSGLYMLEGPGNDIVACTNLVAAGCSLILFTTGRGTPLGSHVPTVKVASNHALAVKKKNWIDFDAGMLLNETPSQAEIDDAFWNHVLAIASGAETKNEINGNRAISIFKDGVTL